ncbi:DUF1028 domain-containing protein [Roseovarius rhodophyticola]|uniref:DUF1028 domain-containing protein n=1 Tax=Roseovarius rhodophyticola TaxID=3080827 RepID=A0ABZ2TGK1_9RHOB|nr:DUF1028 domain-containing protein [Roseovarius sp. W115]MDV2930584.1 DUF1028 domain-containing protein [Roseovarius sp. W115]
MTFSIAGHCQRTGQFGVAITTSSISVGSRCPHARAGVGAVATQNITDPHLATLVLNAMEAGHSASEAIASVVQGRDNIDYRQLTAVDAKGTTAHFTGAHILGTNAISEDTHCVAAGNLLSSTAVAKAITDGFMADPSAHLAERLLSGIEGGLAAGGEEGPVHSAALIVADKMPFYLVDLRVDWEDNGPIEKLRSLWHAYEPQMNDYLNRAIDPSAAPSYGVAGDP